MYKLAQHDWNDVVYDNFYMSVTTFNLHIQVTAEPSYKLDISHVIIALQDSVVAMARLKGFFRLTTLIGLDEQLIGQLDFGNNDGPSDKRITSVPSESTHFFNVNQSDSSLGDSGRIPDPYDPKFIITYDFYGKAIDTKEIFTTVLEGLAISAQIGRNKECSGLEASSLSGIAALSISKSLDNSKQLLYSAVTKALLILVTAVMVPQRKFKEVEFSLLYDGSKFAEGYIFRVVTAHNGTGGIPTSEQA